MQQQEQLIQRQAPRRLGASGIQVPALAIGTQTWGVKAWGYGTGYARDDLYAAYRAALDAGMTFLDTSDSYGLSEELIGTFRAQDGREVVLATKFSPSISLDRSKRTSPNPSFRACGLDMSCCRRSW